MQSDQGLLCLSIYSAVTIDSVKWAIKAQTRLHICAVWSGHLLPIYAIRANFPCCTSCLKIYHMFFFSYHPLGLYHHTEPREPLASRERFGNHSDDLHPQSRERTNSDPLRQRHKQQFLRMGSEPLSSSKTCGHSQDPLGASGSHDSRSCDQCVGHERSRLAEDKKTTDKMPHEASLSDDVDIVESGDFVVANIVPREADDKQDLESISSRGSVLQPSGASMLYTDSEDNRSMSNRSSNLGDSGYMG